VVVSQDRREPQEQSPLCSGIFGVALLPVVGLLSSYLPIWIVMFLPGLMDFMKEARKDSPVYLALAGPSLGPAVGGAYVQYRYADRLALRMAKPRPLERDRRGRAMGYDRGLSLARIASPEVSTLSRTTFKPPFRWAWIRALLDCRHRGLRSLLTPREMEGCCPRNLAYAGKPGISA